MKKIISKIFACLAVCVFALGAVSLVACGEKENPAPTPPPAEISVENAQQLKDALKKDGSIKLTGNIELKNETLLIDKDITLDLNGNKIDAKIEQGNGFKEVFRIAGGKLTINDSNTNKKGSVELTGVSDDDSAYLFYVGKTGDAQTPAVKGELVINGGNYKDNYTPTLLFVRYGVVEINGGKFEVDHATVGKWDEKVNLLNTCDKTKVGGVSNFTAELGFNQETFNYENDVKITIKGGEFKGYNPSAANTDAVVPSGYTTSNDSAEKDEDKLYTVNKAAE